MKLGIDASNLSVRGGGATHLRGVLSGGDPRDFGIHRVIVFAGQEMLHTMPDRPWLESAHHRWLDGGLLKRTLWQSCRLTSELRRHGCDGLLAPCGNYTGSFRPYVAMSHNLLLFEPRERARFGLSLMRLKFAILGAVQRQCFAEADGMIMISQYAKMCIRAALQRNLNDMPVIYHGVGDQFRQSPRPQLPMNEYSAERPFRLLYVSTVSVYKHQDQLLRAFARLVDEGYPIRLDLVGGAYAPALRRLRRLLDKLPEAAERVTYHGSVPITEVHRFYRQADGFVFASSCENMPNILVEAMHAGLPIACSQRGPMPEILGHRGWFFSPDSVDSIYGAVKELLDDQRQRAAHAASAATAAGQFTWAACANQTFDYLARVLQTSAAAPAAPGPRAQAA